MKKSVLGFILAGCMTLSLIACGSSNVDDTQNGAEVNRNTLDEAYEGVQTLGVTEDKIYIGNTVATSGEFATVGIPFNLGLNAALKVYNDNGGFGGKTVELIHYDDAFHAEQGLNLTKKLIEEDQIFALVGHFGTPTITATLDYITSEIGIPMIYGVTGTSQLYQEEASGFGQAVMPVQPIYTTEGQMLLVRAVAPMEGNLGLGGTKIGVISTNDEMGKGLLAGIQKQEKEIADVIVKYVTTVADKGADCSSAVNALKEEGCDVIILAVNKAAMGELITNMKDADLGNVKIITSYVNGDEQFLSSLPITERMEVYTTDWLDITSATYVYTPSEDNVAGVYLWACYQALAGDDATMYEDGVSGYSEEYWKAAEAICAYDLAVNGAASTTAFANSYNSYALAGYIAGTMFLEGLHRVEESQQELTWQNYIKAMESAPVDIPMGGSVNLANGARLGTTDFALNRYDLSSKKLILYSEITTIESVKKITN